MVSHPACRRHGRCRLIALRKPVWPALLATGALAVTVCLIAAILGLPPGVHAGWSAGLAGALLALTFIDTNRFILPDAITLPLMLAGLAQSLLHGTPSLIAASSGALLGYGVIWALAQWYRRTRGVEGIGMGDGKLLAAGGVWTGALGLPLILLLASSAGLIFAMLIALYGRKPVILKSAQRVAFGPFLAFGIWTSWCVGQLPFQSI